MSENNGVFSRDAFLAARKTRAIVTVNVADWGYFNVRKLTLGQLRKIDEATDNYERAKLLILESILDNANEPIFKSVEDVNELEMSLFKALSDMVAEVNALKIKDEDIKNSEPATTYVLN